MLRTTIAALIAFSFAPAQAELVAVQHVEKETVVKDEKGVERVQRVPAQTVKPGEQVIYALRFTNTARKAADNVVLVMPVPTQITYVEGSVSGDGAAIMFSADGGETYLARGRLTVTEGGEERPARNADITHIKWTLASPLPAAGKGEVSYRGVLK